MRASVPVCMSVVTMLVLPIFFVHRIKYIVMNRVKYEFINWSREIKKPETTYVYN